ncbi:YhgE/Pip domain-containing protein [Deinococcus sp. YIM 77859]|uniref:YhgE/Pip domain-containing protein n=1 Tax=Deinococcus sp. YIM 77859 TaxID=1540221 RepID=UPI00054EE1EC|nr:YhgE/Pip domain-containing protein [Deinococcus sp. YIM 77859]
MSDHRSISPDSGSRRSLIADYRQLTPSERRLWRAPLMWGAALAILFIPVLYVAIYLASVWDPYGHLEALPVALVNSDAGTTYRGKTYHLGRDLVEELRQDPPVRLISYPSERAAQEAVRRGDVYFALTIPPNFSRQAVAAKSSEHGALHLYSSPGTSYFASRVGSSVAEELASSINSRLGSNRWEVVQTSLADLQQGFRDLKAATRQLRDGASRLEDGAGQLARGAGDLAQGAASAHTGGEQLTRGAQKLSAGVSRLTGGTAQLSAGLRQLNRGAPDAPQLQPLRQGAAQLVQGSASLANGLKQLQGGAQQLQSGTADLARGAGQVKRGADSLAGGLPQLSNGLGQLQGGAQELSGGAGKLAQAAKQLQGGAQQLAAQLQNGPQVLSVGASDLARGAGQLEAGLEKLQAGAETVQSRLGPAVQGSADAAKGAERLAQGSEQLRAGAAGLEAGAVTLADKLGEAAEGSTNAAKGAERLAQGAAQLQSGVHRLQTGAAALAEKTGAAAAGAQRLAVGAQSLQQGVNTLVEGNIRIKGALKTITGELPAQQDLDQLRDGARTLAAKTGELTQGLGRLQTGAQRVATGTVKLQSGARDLQEGLRRLYDRVPDRIEQLGGDPEGLAASVVVREQAAAPVKNNGEAFAPYFIALALWVGGTLTTFLFPYLLLPESGRNTSQLARVLRKLTVPAAYVVAQALIVVLGVRLLGASFLHPGLVVLTAVTGSLTFLGLILALNLLLGAAGRLLALVLLVLQLAASGGSYPVELSSPFFRAIHTFIPVTDVVNALRFAMFGAYEGQYGVFMARMLLVGLVGVGVALLSRSRWQFTPDEQFRSPIITDVG